MERPLNSWRIVGLLAGLNSLLVIVAFSAGFWTHASLNAQALDTHATYPLLGEVQRLLSAHFIRPLPEATVLEYGAVRGMLDTLDDPYTVFIEPQAHEIESQVLAGEYGGIGVSINQQSTGEIVLTPFLDSPAAQAGVQDGDVLLAVDEHVVTLTTTLEEATTLIRGLIGTPVKITVRHSSKEEATFTVTRQRIEIPSATWRLVEAHPTLGLITLSRFSDKTPGEVARALTELSAQGATSYILDLRNNGGGILESAVEVATQFLDGGVVLYETQRDNPERVYSAPANSTAAATAPLIVLVNGNTASAAEILAGALLDRERAPLVGQTTYGKGSVQLVYELSDRSSLHVTAYLWSTPSRRQLDGTGLAPSFEIQPATDGTDAEMAFAIQYLEDPNHRP